MAVATDRSPVRVRPARPADAPQVAALHRRTIPWGLLSQLGPGAVAAFYEALLSSPLGFGFVAEQEGRAVGFVCGVVHWRGFVLRSLARRPRMTAAMALGALRRSRTRRLVETARYAAAGGLPPAELVAIGVDGEARGRGVAEALVRRLLVEFERRGVRRVRVTTDVGNERARRLYRRLGFRHTLRTEVHPGRYADVFVIDVDGRSP
jgi:ribosomal protein S18 acetylase RimI-like enzyme